MNYEKDFLKFSRSEGISSPAMEAYKSITNDGTISPSIIEEREMNMIQMDVFSRLMKDRIIYLGTGINDTVSNIITAQLLYLDSVSNEPIQIYVNSPGGSVSSGYAIIDVMDYINSPVSTLCVGQAASMGAVILSNGDKGSRAALKHSRVMIHQPSGGFQGTSADMEITMEQILILKKELYTTLSDNCGQPYEKIEEDSKKDFWMKSDEAVKYGIIDEVVKKMKEKV
jgi:ATP-dependent Clp protease, protease subunit